VKVRGVVAVEGRDDEDRLRSCDAGRHASEMSST
jgi:5S rRNA maturation endonuclease (ribonuclease M5)